MDEFFARNRLSAYLDGELPASEAKEVEEAIARSPALRAEVEALREAVDLLRRGGPVPAPAGFAARLDARLAKETIRRRAFPRVRLEVAMIAAAAVVVLVFAARRPDAPAEEAAPAPAPQPVASAPPEPAPAEPGAAPAEPSSTDGALDEPKLARKGTPTKAKASGVPRHASKGGGGVEKEAYVPDWEKADATEAGPTSLFSAPSMRYRLVPAHDTGLKELAAAAAALGGRLTDDKGRPLAPYPMDPGDSRVVRVEIPAYNVGAVEAKLKELGSVELVSMGNDATLFAKDATTAVTVEVRQP